MDPLTQAVVGAALPQSLSRRRDTMMKATLLGLIAGMLPDLDVLIRSPEDPMLFLEYHRQFTHSFIFIPVGGLICALSYCLIFRKLDRGSFLIAWTFAALGYGTHGLLDAFTSYGTSLFWPFSDARIAFNIISIVDPLFSLPVALLVLLALLKRRPRFAGLALVWAALYLSFGAWQNSKATAMAKSLAEQRGHKALRFVVKPSFANQLVWRVIYETEDRYYIDAVRPTFSPRVFNGEDLPKLDVARDFPNLDPASQQARDIDRFRRFSNGFIALDPKIKNRIIDIRYAVVPNEIGGLWSIKLSDTAKPTDFAQFQTHRDNARDGFWRLWAMIKPPNEGTQK